MQVILKVGYRHARRQVLGLAPSTGFEPAPVWAPTHAAIGR